MIEKQSPTTELSSKLREPVGFRRLRHSLGIIGFVGGAYFGLVPLALGSAVVGIGPEAVSYGIDQLKRPSVRRVKYT